MKQMQEELDKRKKLRNRFEKPDIPEEELKRQQNLLFAEARKQQQLIENAEEWSRVQQEAKLALQRQASVSSAQAGSSTPNNFNNGLNSYSDSSNHNGNGYTNNASSNNSNSFNTNNSNQFSLSNSNNGNNINHDDDDDNYDWNNKNFAFSRIFFWMNEWKKEIKIQFNQTQYISNKKMINPYTHYFLSLFILPDSQLNF